MLTFIILLALILLAIILINLLLKFKVKMISKLPENNKILHLTVDNFDQLTKGKIVLVDFWAEWYMPCKMMIPTLNDLANELPDGKYVGKINIETDQFIADKFSIRNIPTLILFQDGKEINRFIGVITKDFLIKAMK